MKNKILIPIALLVFCWQPAKAQITQIEFTSGFNKTGFSSFSIKPLDENGNFSLATLAFFQKYHQEEEAPFDELGVQATSFWNIGKNFAVGPTLYYNSVAGFTERISLLIRKGNEKFVFIAVPALVRSEKTKALNGDLFIQMQLLSPLKNEWYFLAFAQILSSWDKFTTHARSFQQIRIGLSHNNNQFGLAADFDQYGAKPIDKTTIGFFLRKVFITK